MEFSEVEAAVATLEKAARGLRPELLFPGDAARAFELVVRGERHLASMRTTLSARLAESGVWKESGFATPQAFVAARTGTSFGAARDTIETGRRLREQPEVAEEFTSGRLSPEKVREVSEAVEADPSAAEGLLDLARHSTLKTVRDEARDVKAKAQAAALGAHEALRAARTHRSWVERSGALRGEYVLPPEEGARFRVIHGEETRRFLRRAKQRGVELTPDQASADALVNLVTGEAKPSGNGRPKVIFRVDLDAYRRGAVRPHETCEIVGVGQVPVEVVHKVVERDAFVAAVVSCGSDLKVAKSLGRHLKADVRAALEWAYTECSVDGCDVSWGLEYDHWEVDYSESHVTGFFEVSPLCGPHHDLKTYEGYTLDGEPGHFRMVPPAGPDPPDTS